MDSRTGKLIAHGRLFDADSGNTIVVAASHGVLRGPLPGLASEQEIDATLSRLTGADAVMMSPGMLPRFERHVIGRGTPELVIEVDWKNSGRGIYEPGGSQVTSAQIAAIERCAAAGAVAVMTFLYVGQDDVRLEREEIERNARLAQACDDAGILCVMEPRSAQERVDPELASSEKVLAWYCRLAAELGADVVKCIWPGRAEVFEAACAGATVPVLLAGGADAGSLSDTLQLFRSAIDAGARGVMAGRRVYTGGEATQALEAIRGVVHGGNDVATALAASGRG